MSNATDALLLVDPYTGRPMDELGTALTWENLAGIALGWVMFLVLEPLVIWVNFAPWIVNPARRPRPTPERYLHACVHSFVAMVVTGGVLFAGFSDLRHHKETTALVKWFGYNNVCIVFDSPPSTYVCPIFWFAVGYLAVRFAHEDTAQRIAPMTHVSEAHKTLAKLANTAFAMVAAFFSLCLAIRPEDDMITHSAPFVALVLGFALLYVLHFFQFQGKRPKEYIFMVVVYTLLSLVKASFTVIALVTEGAMSVPSTVGKPVDTLWVILALFAPFFFHPPSATKELYSEQLVEATEAYRKARLKTYIVVKNKTHVRRDIKHDPMEEKEGYKTYLKKGTRIKAEEVVGGELRFGGTLETNFKGGWITIAKRDGTAILDATVTYRCIFDIAIFKDHDSDSPKMGKLYAGELVESEGTQKNKARGNVQKDFIKIARGWVPLVTINGVEAVQPAKSFKCIKEAPIRASSKKNSPTIGYLKPGELINALEVTTSRSGKTKVKFQDSSHGTGWVFRSVPGSSAPVLEEVNSRVPTTTSRDLAMDICELQEQFDQRAGESWRVETARVVNKIHAGARRREAVTAPLFLIFAAWLILGLILHLIASLVRRTVLNRIQSSAIFQSVTKLNTSIPGLSTMGGDIVGYLRYLKGWNNFLLKAQEQHNQTVFAENIGSPVLMALDVNSAKRLIFDGVNVQEEALGMNIRFLPSLFAGQRPTFTRDGLAAKISREFLLALMPKFTTNDKMEDSNPRLSRALKALFTEFRRWTRMHPSDLQDVEGTEAMGAAIVKFASFLLLGETLDPELVRYIQPYPGCFPTHPSFIPFLPGWFPTRLLPSWYKAKYVSDKLFDQMKTSPNWTVYTVRGSNTNVYVSPLCRDTERRFISKDKSEFDKSQETDLVMLASGDRLVVEDVVNEQGKSVKKDQKPYAIRFSKGWIGSKANGTKNELQTVPLREGWVKVEDLEEPIIPSILKQLRWDAVTDQERKEMTKEKRKELDFRRQFLTDDAACGNILIWVSFNAAQLSNSLLMPFFVLPELLKSNPRLGSNDDLLDSMAWELLRHNGGPLKKRIRKKITRVSSSKGCPLVPMSDLVDESLLTTSEHKEYSVPEGTTVFTHTGLLQRDRTYWEKPHTFMADRFMKYDDDEEGGATFKSADEPFPTLGFGYPLQGRQVLTYEDDVVQQSHGEVFGPLMQPFLKLYLKRLVNDFDFALEKLPDKVTLSKTKSGRSEHFSTVDGFGPANIKGGMRTTDDMLPKLAGGVRFAVFQFNDATIESAMFDYLDTHDKDPRWPGIKYTKAQFAGAEEDYVEIDRAPGMKFYRKDIGSNISEMKYAEEFNQIFAAYEFATVPSKAKFAQDYKSQYPSHRVVPDGMDLERYYPDDTDNPGKRMGDGFIHVSKVLLQRRKGNRDPDDPTAAQARVMLKYWKLFEVAEAHAKLWNEWDWDPWAQMAKYSYKDEREHKRKGFGQELKEYLAEALNIEEPDASATVSEIELYADPTSHDMFKITDKLVAEDNQLYDPAFVKGQQGIKQLREQLANTLVELRTQQHKEKTGQDFADENARTSEQLKKSVEDIREELAEKEQKYMGLKQDDVGKSIMEVKGVGWCMSRRRSDDDSEVNENLVHWDVLATDPGKEKIPEEIGDGIRELAIKVRGMSDYQKAEAELAELTAVRYLYETVDLDDDGVIEAHEIEQSHDVEREMRKIRSFGGWTIGFVRDSGETPDRQRDPQLDEVKIAMHRSKAESRGEKNARLKADADGDGKLDAKERVAYYTDLANQKRLAEISRQAKNKARGKKVQLIRPPPHAPHKSLGRNKRYSDMQFRDQLQMLMKEGKWQARQEMRLGGFNRDEEAKYYFDHPEEAPEGWTDLMEAYYGIHPVVATPTPVKAASKSKASGTKIEEETLNPMIVPGTSDSAPGKLASKQASKQARTSVLTHSHRSTSCPHGLIDHHLTI
jgi:hypothetical protein